MTTSTRTGGYPGELDEDDARLAAALSHYVRGLVAEAEEGQRSSRALDEFEQAAALDPLRERLQARVAGTALVQGDAERAVQALQRMCSLNPTSVTARVDLASVYQFLGENDKAQEAYRSAVALDPLRSLTYWDWAQLLFSADRDAEAMAILRDGYAHGEQPDVLNVYIFAQTADFIRRGKVDRALPCLELLVEYGGKERRSEFLSLMAEIYVISGDDDKAVEAIGQIETERLSPALFMRLAMLQMRRGADVAIPTIHEGLRRFPDDRRLLFILAYACSRADKAGEAIGAYARLAEIAEKEGTPLSSDTYALYGNVCELAGDRERAEAIMQECVAKYPDAHEALNYLAYTWAERGEKLDEALEYVQRALAIEPDNGAYVDTLGWIYFKRRQYADALREIRRADVLLPGDPTIKDHLGDAYSAVGEPDAAVEHWRESLLLNPEDETVAGKLKEHGVDVDEIRKRAAEATAVAPEPEPQTAE